VDVVYRRVMPAHGRRTARTKPKRKPADGTDRRSLSPATLASIAESVGVAVEHLTVGAAPGHTPWSSPLDRVTYPREEVELTDEYVEWLKATVADAARHLEFAYRGASRANDRRAALFLPAARILRMAAVDLVREDVDGLVEYSPGARAMKALPYVPIPTRLFVDPRPSHACDAPFEIGGDIVMTDAEQARLLIYSLQSWIRVNAAVTIAEERARDKHVASQVARMVAQAAFLPLLRSPPAAPATEIARAFRADLRAAVVRWPETSDSAERAIELTSEPWTGKLRTLAVRFAQTLLMIAGHPAQEARTMLDAVRKEDDRAASRHRSRRDSLLKPGGRSKR
jgi:hypothetical protein